jgi:hypothetical protein
MSQQSAVDKERIRIVHNLVLNRLYHEDYLLTQRTYNFLTFNVFLGAVYTLNFSQSRSPSIGYLVAILGIILSTLHIALGHRIDRSIAFWREYLKLLEDSASLPVDHVLFDFYETAEVKTDWGTITHRGKNRRPMFKTFPWSIMPSTNLMIGVLLPWLISTIWFAAMAIPLYRNNRFLLVFVFLGYILVTAFTWWGPRPAWPEVKADE